LSVERNGTQVLFRVQWLPEMQGQIIDRFFEHVEDL